MGIRIKDKVTHRRVSVSICGNYLETRSGLDLKAIEKAFEAMATQEHVLIHKITKDSEYYNIIEPLAKLNIFKDPYKTCVNKKECMSVYIREYHSVDRDQGIDYKCIKCKKSLLTGTIKLKYMFIDKKSIYDNLQKK